MSGRALALALAVLAACGHALREPRPLPPAAVPASKEEAPALLAQADAEYALRPDPGAVRRADERYLAAAQADPLDVAGLVGSVRAKAWLIDHEPDGKARAEDAAAAVDAGQWCLRRAPASAACDYALALALGLQAREKRSTAIDALKKMVEHLRRAAAADPRLDQAGPHRVLALVLLRAPGWPLGPGDPETGLAEARRAAALFPDHVPNQLALAEALLRNDAADEGRATAARALAHARERAAAGDPDAPEWVRAAEKLAKR